MLLATEFVRRQQPPQHPDGGLELRHVRILREAQVLVHPLHRLLELRLQVHQPHGAHAVQDREPEALALQLGPVQPPLGQRPQLVMPPGVLLVALPGVLEHCEHPFLPAFVLRHRVVQRDVLDELWHWLWVDVELWRKLRRRRSQWMGMQQRFLDLRVFLKLLPPLLLVLFEFGELQLHLRLQLIQSCIMRLLRSHQVVLVVFPLCDLLLFQLFDLLQALSQFGHPLVQLSAQIVQLVEVLPHNDLIILQFLKLLLCRYHGSGSALQLGVFFRLIRLRLRQRRVLLQVLPRDCGGWARQRKVRHQHQEH
mmetsp:Transcript_26706/g.45396  ORF Transcript_26706/g.45396 Transcript_26706/m.45396 type:complete len:309 (+) Transcript_26706:277-1203(+)